MDNKIPIFLMFENKPEWTEVCLKYLRENTNKDLYRLILINNGSSAFNRGRIVDLMLEEDKIIDFDIPVSVSFAYNVSIIEHIKDSEYFVILHNDAMVTDGWLDRYINYAKKNETFSSMFPRTNYCTEYTAVKYDVEKNNIFLKFKMENQKKAMVSDILEVIDKTYEEDGGLNEYALGIGASFEGGSIVSDEMCCFCNLFKSDVFKLIGGFDDSFISSGGEIKLFNYRCYEKEIYPIMALDIFVHHNGNTTTDSISHNYVLEKKAIDDMVIEKIETIKKKRLKDIKTNTKMINGNISLLIARDDGIGDIIMSLFSIAGIKDKFKNMKVTYATKSGFMGFVSRFKCVNNVIQIPEYDENLNYKLVTSKEIESILDPYINKFDIIINLIKYFEITNKDDNSHRVDQVLSLIKRSYPLVFDSSSPIYPEYVPKDGSIALDKIIKKGNLPIVGIVCDGTCDIRSLNKDVFEKIIEIESESKIVIILGKDKIRLYSKKIKKSNIINLSGKTNLEDIPPILKKCEYVYTPDSGIFHMAGIMNIPCRAFFSTVDPKLRDGYYPSSDKNVIYYKEDMPCVPCGDIGCSKIDCMKYTDDEIKLITKGEPIRNE